MDILEIMKPIGFPPQSRDQAIRNRLEILGLWVLRFCFTEAKTLRELEGKSLIMIMWILPREPGRKPQKWVQREARGTSLVVEWLRLCAPNAGGLGSIPDQRTRSHMSQLRHTARSYILQLKLPCMLQQRSHVQQLRPGAARLIKINVKRKGVTQN